MVLRRLTEVRGRRNSMLAIKISTTPQNNAEDGQNKSEALSMKVNDESVVQGMLPAGFLELVLDFAANF